MQLNSSNVQIEVALAPLCKQLPELGRTYRLLRSFRPLVEASPETVAECSLLGSLVPHSLALTALFSHAPAELPSPHQVKEGRISKSWLDK